MNERMLELARARLAEDAISNAELIQASATELPFRDGEFDLAYSFSTLLLIPDSDAAVREIARVVREGGFTVLDLTGRLNLSYRHWRRWYRGQGHFGLSAYRLRDALRLHRECGLEPVEVHAIGAADQWKYLRGAHRLAGLERKLHAAGSNRDLDYRLSNVPGLRSLANRWYVVAQKQTSP
jgi:ubiquinone/menaquinone biosynthesis C-methylase UbiE